MGRDRNSLVEFDRRELVLLLCIFKAFRLDKLEWFFRISACMSCSTSFKPEVLRGILFTELPLREFYVSFKGLNYCYWNTLGELWHLLFYQFLV